MQSNCIVLMHSYSRRCRTDGMLRMNCINYIITTTTTIPLPCLVHNQSERILPSLSLRTIIIIISCSIAGASCHIDGVMFRTVLIVVWWGFFLLLLFHYTASLCRHTKYAETMGSRWKNAFIVPSIQRGASGKNMREDNLAPNGFVLVMCVHAVLRCASCLLGEWILLRVSFPSCAIVTWLYWMV